jgi:ABC-type transport system involved in multi-copper enzyme maturation permease subunit
MNTGRLAAVVRKELRVYLRSRSIVGTMVVLPLLFLVEPLGIIFGESPLTPASEVQKLVGSVFLILLITPAILPAVISAYSVVGERDQGTLEPLLTTPLRREELLLGKALAVIAPSVIIAYLIFATIGIAAQFFALNPAVAPALGQGPHIVAEVLFTPLLAGWSSWVGIGISARSSDARVAQQLGTMASLPPLAIAALMAYNVFAPSVQLAVVFGVGLLAADIVMWRIVSAMFDRERLITGAKAQKDRLPAALPRRR